MAFPGVWASRLGWFAQPRAEVVVNGHVPDKVLEGHSDLAKEALKNLDDSVESRRLR